MYYIYTLGGKTFSWKSLDVEVEVALGNIYVLEFFTSVKVHNALRLIARLLLQYFLREVHQLTQRVSLPMFSFFIWCAISFDTALSLSDKIVHVGVIIEQNIGACHEARDFIFALVEVFSSFILIFWSFDTSRSIFFADGIHRYWVNKKIATWWRKWWVCALNKFFFCVRFT